MKRIRNVKRRPCKFHDICYLLSSSLRGPFNNQHSLALSLNFIMQIPLRVSAICVRLMSSLARSSSAKTSSSK